MKHYTRVLTIAGSDSGGGAGIQADLKTFSALGCYGMSVITAVTAQNSLGVSDVMPVSVDNVEKQIDAVLSDIGADAVKIGMLWSVELIHSVAEMLKRYSPRVVVLDPVMIAQSGDRLLQREAEEAVLEYLVPYATVFTPNIPEASILSGRAIETDDDMKRAAVEFSEKGCDSVLIKGGHASGHECSDMLYLAGKDTIIYHRSERIDTVNNHGTGCTLSSAIAAFLAKGHSIETAVEKSKNYITGALKAGADYSIGRGHGPVHHFFSTWE